MDTSAAFKMKFSPPQTSVPRSRCCLTKGKWGRLTAQLKMVYIYCTYRSDFARFFMHSSPSVKEKGMNQSKGNSLVFSLR